MKKSLIIAVLVTMNATMVFARESRDTAVGERIATRLMEKKESEQKERFELKKCLLQNPNAKC